MLITVLIIAACVIVALKLYPKIKSNVAAARLAEKEEAARQAERRRQTEEHIRNWIQPNPTPNSVRIASPAPARSTPASHVRTDSDSVPETHNPVWYTPASVLNAMPDTCAAESNSGSDSSSSSDSGCSSDSGSSSSDSN